MALCAEFPGLSWVGGTPESSLRSLRKVVAGVIEDRNASGEAIPAPRAQKRYSGKFMVRVPPQVHRNLALEAAESGVSLNRLVSARLARAAGG